MILSAYNIENHLIHPNPTLLTQSRNFTPATHMARKERSNDAKSSGAESRKKLTPMIASATRLQFEVNMV
jgi:hypothetical protein